MKTPSMLLFLAASTHFCFGQSNAEVYPVAPHSSAIDTIWGQNIADPYRMLEKESEDVKKWLDAEKKISDNYFKKIRHKYDSDFTSGSSYINNIPYRSGPYYIRGGSGFGGMNIYYKNYVRDNLTFLYNTSLVSAKAESFTQVVFSKSGKYCALAYSNTDNDWEEIRVLNKDNMLLLKDHISNVRYSDITWFQSGFYYSRFDSVNESSRHIEVQSNQRLYYHKIETDASLDKLIFENPDNPYSTFSVQVTDDERFIILQEHNPEDDKNTTYLRDTKNNQDFITLFTERSSKTTIVGSTGDTLLAFSTNNGAFNGQLVEIDTKNPRQWGVVLENQLKYRIKEIIYAEEKYCVVLQEGFKEYLCLFSRNGDILKTITLPEGSSNNLVCYAPDQHSIIIRKNYYTNPPIGELLSLKDYSLTIIDRTSINFDPFHYKFFLTNYKSRDGTLIPLYLVMAKDYLKKTKGPALLKIYGGFGTSPEAIYSPDIFSFLNNGGIYAVANVRGGSSSIQNWHESGSLLNKQNTIDDTYYAAKFLIDSGFANPHQLAITGRDNGALVAAATINQHPEIFKAAVLNVGMYDMMRYENFTAGKLWTREYGSIRDSAQFSGLRSYSPLHNIKRNTNYPSMLVSTSEYDDVMPPLHSYKFLASLQEQTRSSNPILLNVNEKLGHRSLNNRLFFSFLFTELNMKYKPSSYYKDK